MSKTKAERSTGRRAEKPGRRDEDYYMVALVELLQAELSYLRAQHAQHVEETARTLAEYERVLSSAHGVMDETA